MSVLLASGTIIHQRYQVRQLIRQGNMSAVYVATDQTFRSTVALKQMFPRPSVTPQQVTAMKHTFGYEARMLHLLRHSVPDTEPDREFRQHRSDE